MADLKAQYHGIKAEIDAAIAGVLESSQFCLGSEVAAFEREYAAYCQAKFCAGMNSGTSALHLALLAAGVGPGDEVITVPFTFVASIASILYAGARPVLVDIDPSTFTIDPNRIEQAITPKTKAILPVHLYGHPADMDPIVAIAKRRGLKVIEDAAQAHGAEYKGRRAGSIGELGCYSFYPGKNLGAYGEGGAVVTSSESYDRMLRSLRNWGCEKRYHHDLKGFNYRLEGMQGAVLRVKLRHLEKWTELRRQHAASYTRLLKGCGAELPHEAEYAKHVYHCYVVRVHRRDAVQKYLNEHGVDAAIHYPIPVHMQKGYADLGYKAGDFPHSEKAAAEVLSLPLYAEMTDAQIETVASALREALKR
jgi:dTDP-4-amino-4,6-dideoxygalactose transaminase